MKDILKDLFLTQFGVQLKDEDLDKLCEVANPLLENPEYEVKMVTTDMGLKECNEQLEIRKEIRDSVSTDLFKWIQEQEVLKVSKAIEATETLIRQFSE